MSFSKLFHQHARTSLLVRSLLTLTLTIGAGILAIEPAHALTPLPPRLTGITTIPQGGSNQSVRITFVKGDANTLTGYLYTTNNGGDWKECVRNGPDCDWDKSTDATTLIIRKESLASVNSYMSNGATLNIRLKACWSGGSGSTPLGDCSIASSNLISYTIGAAAASVISTSSTVANGTTAVIQIEGSDFKTPAGTGDFTFTYGTTGLSSPSITQESPTAITFTFTGTANYGNITIQAKTTAYSVASDASNTITVTVPNVVPETPTAVSGTMVNSGQINVSWTAPLINRGDTITSYIVYYRTVGAGTWSSTTSSTTSKSVTGLQPATSYEFKVAAVNTAGTGPESLTSAQVTTGSGPAVPETPTSVSASSATDTSVQLSWTAPSNDGGAAISGYWIQKSSDNGSTWETFTVTNTTATSISVTGLTASTAYKFRVAAKNSIGFGPFNASPWASLTTSSTPTVPETPTAVSAGSATSSSLSVTWSAPGNNGGATIDVYRVQYSTDGTTWTTASSSASSPYTASGLTASTSYYFRVAAHNSAGWGPYSDSSTAVSTSAPSSTPAPAPEVEFAPVITDVSKLKVCARGHENFVIRGNHFRNAAVTIDGIQVSVKGKSDNVINISFGETPAGKKKITVTNSAGSASIEIEFKLVDRTAFKVFDIPYIYKGGSFEYQFEAFGENTYRITGNLPGGLVLDAENGIIYGVPTEEGKFNFVLHADGLCGNDVDVIKLDIDKAIPNAISHRIKFTNKKNKKIVGAEQFELKKFLKMVKEISPKQIEPVIYITGGSPENEPEVDSTSAKDRRDSLCDIMINQDVIGQTVLGLFDGEEDEIEIFVYWPVVR